MSLELLHGVLAAHEWLSLREVVRLLLLSGLFSAWCCIAFPKNASSRRVLLLTAIVSMALLPWLLRSIDLQWQLPVAIMPSIHLELGVPNLLVCIWLFVAVVLISLHLHRVRSELQRVAGLTRVSDPLLLKEIRQLRASLLPNYPNLPMPEVRLGGQACATTLRGCLLVLPYNWATLSVDTRRSVLAHELTHIARGDDRWLLLLRLLLLCYWWMPWLRKLQQVYVQSMEESCDDVASELIGAQHTYAQALYEVALNSSPITKMQKQNLYLAHIRGHHLLARVARFGQRRPLELDTAGVFWTLMLITLAVVWVSGVQPVLARKDADSVKPAQVYQLSVSPLGVPSSYPIVTDQSVSVPMDSVPPWRLQNPMRLTTAVYPGNALAAGYEHEVTVSFAVADDGTVVQPRAYHQDKYGFAQSALRAVRTSRYLPVYKVMDIQSNSVAMRRAVEARRLTVSPHVKPVRYERRFSFRIDRRP